MALTNAGSAVALKMESAAHADERDLPARQLTMRALRAHIHLAAGDWDRCSDIAST
jgi:hypothetical protein